MDAIGINLSFSTDNKKPVTVINAENFKGKTTLLNAFRFALTGSIYGRFSGSKNSEKVISSFINNISKKRKTQENFLSN